MIVFWTIIYIAVGVGVWQTLRANDAPWWDALLSGALWPILAARNLGYRFAYWGWSDK